MLCCSNKDLKISVAYVNKGYFSPMSAMGHLQLTVVILLLLLSRFSHVQLCVTP